MRYQVRYASRVKIDEGFLVVEGVAQTKAGQTDVDIVVISHFRGISQILNFYYQSLLNLQLASLALSPPL